MIKPSLNINTITEVKTSNNDPTRQFVNGDICKYLIDWPSGSTYKDELIFDVNVLTRVTLIMTEASSYSESAIR